MLNPKRWRKLKSGEHRYISKSNRPVIYKPKHFKKWKQNKFYDKQLKVFIFKVEIKPPPPEKKERRIRKQFVVNSNYGISIRAIVINSDITVEVLEQIINKFIKNDKFLPRIPFESEGFEEEEIDNKEDSTLKDGTVYIELNVRGKVTLIPFQDVT